MKGFILIALLLPCLAFGSWDWKVKESRSYFGMSQMKISKILTQFPEILEGTDYTAKDMDYISVAETIFEWTGETICTADDERLLHYDLTYMACPKKDIINCIVQIRVMLQNEDPCL